MRNDLKLLSENGARDMALHMFTYERLCVRAKEANLNREDWDLNPHLSIVNVADLVVEDLKTEGFDEITREEVYLTWLNAKIYGPELTDVSANKSFDSDTSPLPWDEEDDRLAHGE